MKHGDGLCATEIIHDNNNNNKKFDLKSTFFDQLPVEHGDDLCATDNS